MVVHDYEPGWETYVEHPGHGIQADVAITAVAARSLPGIILEAALRSICGTT
jgi:protease I